MTSAVEQATRSDSTKNRTVRARRRLGNRTRRIIRLPRLPIIAASLFCLVPLLWFEPGGIAQGADYNNPLNPGREISQILSGWNADNLGQSSFRQAPRLFPYLTFWRASEALGLSPGGTQRLWFVSLFALAFVSAWLLARSFFGNRSVGKWAVPVIVLVYLFNPFTVTSWTVGHNVQFLAYAVAPLWLLVLHRTVLRKASLTSGLQLGLVSLLFASTWNNPPMILTMVVFPSVLILIFVVATRQLRFRGVIGRGIACLPWLFLLNAWWVLPFAYAAVQGTGYAYPGSSVDLLSNWGPLATSVDFFEFMRGLGHWGAYAGYGGLPYFPWAESYASPLIVAAAVWMVTLGFLPMLHRRPSLIASLAATLVLIGIFFSKGINPPLDSVNRWMYLHVPGFYLFRGTYEKFGGLIFLGVLIALALYLSRPLSRSRSVAVLVATFLATLAASWPLLTGAVMPSLNAIGVNSVVRIPNYYDDLREWTKQGGDVHSLLTVPQPPIGYIKTTWAYAGSDPIQNFSDVPVITGAPEASPQDGPGFAAFLRASAEFDNSEYLRQLGITHVIVRTDIDPTFYWGTPTPKKVEARLNKAGFELVQTFGALRIYEVPSDIPVSIDEALGTPNNPSFHIPVGAKLPFHTELHDVDGPVFVVLPQDFDPRWELRLRSQDGSARVISHVRTLEFANGWWIDGEGNIAVEAGYRNTPSVGAGLAIAALALMGGGMLVIRQGGRPGITPLPSGQSGAQEGPE
jgi:arabinofuranan 3-O-arabinosyltransferase